MDSASPCGIQNVDGLLLFLDYSGLHEVDDDAFIVTCLKYPLRGFFSSLAGECLFTSGDNL